MSSYNLEQLRKEIVYINEMIFRWKDHLKKQDSGSYCENSSYEYTKALKTVKLLKELLRELIEHD